MANDLPEFDAPPVVETVLSAQFAPLPAFTLAHAAWFWKSYLDSSWQSVTEVARLNDVFEHFGAERVWRQQAIQIMPVGKESLRLQIVRDDQERMIQVQNSRFVQNWRKREGDYPSYRKLLPEFQGHFEKFQQFAKDAGFGSVDTNQWEVVYVNRIRKGEMWESPGDWKAIFPWFSMPLEGGHEFDSFANGEWQFVLGAGVGRLVVALKHVSLDPSKNDQEAIQLQLTARGPVQPDKGIDLFRGFDLAHEEIVRAFTAMTSSAAHKHWKRRL